MAEMEIRMTGREHCWHETGIMLTSNPPQWPGVCCHCDARRVRTYREVPLSGHGPFSPGGPPVRHETVYWGGEESCVVETVDSGDEL